MSQERHINSNILEVKNLSVKITTPIQDLYILENVNFAIQKGSCLALIGESGCGKSMTANAIIRLLPSNASYSSESEIIFGNDDLLTLPESKMRQNRGSKLSMIFQDPMTSLNPVLTVGAQLFETIKLSAIHDKADLVTKAVDLLTQVRIPDPRGCLQRYPHELSGGMKQRVMIAMMLAPSPKLLIADEPTTALDVTTESKILQIIKEQQQSNDLALLLITHDLSMASTIADYIAIMYAGTIVEYAKTSEILDNPKHPYTQKLLSAKPGYKSRNHKLVEISGTVPRLDHKFDRCTFLSRCDKVSHKCHEQYPVSENDAGHKVLCWNKDIPPSEFKRISLREPKCSKNIILSAKNISINYDVKKTLFKNKLHPVYAVSDVSISLNEGEALAIVGESGSGKTTFAKGLMGLIKLNAGEVLYKNTVSLANRHEYLKNVQIVFQDSYSALNPKLTIAQVIYEALEACASKHVLPRECYIDKLLLLVGLNEFDKNKYPHEFSGGQRQRICIARALAVNPKVLICDEPTSALDLSIQAQILNLLFELKLTNNLSYIFITHDLSVVSYFADKVAVMYQGKLVEHGTVEQVLFHPENDYTKTLIDSANGVGVLCI